MKSTVEAAGLLGIQPKTLLKIVQRHEQLRPAAKWGSAYMWTSAEIEAIRQYKSAATMGRPRKDKDNADTSTPD